MSAQPPIVRRRLRAVDWRRGWPSDPWGSSVLAAGLAGLGAGVALASMLSAVGGVWAQLMSTGTLWLCLMAATAYAFRRRLPEGLLQLNPLDVLYGVGLGLTLRGIEGVLSNANSDDFPSLTSLSGAIPSGWWLNTAFPAVLAGPLVEEFFFRGLVLVAVFQWLRRPLGAAGAGLAALALSTAAFVLLHAVFRSLLLSETVELSLVGFASGALLLLTGRIWGAVILHATYNAAFLALSLAGNLLA